MLPASLFTLTILTFYVGVTTELEHECLEPKVNCGNGRCISHLWRCDGVDDCGNMKDEENCDNPKDHIKCRDYEFQCDDGRCITSMWLCDGEHDCIDESDEKNCSNVSNCDGFRCSDNHCLPKRWECDGDIDCADGADEKSCHLERKTLCEGEFACSSGSCISLNKVCDGVDDCTDGSDEGHHCIDCRNKTCDQNCRATPSGPECFCSAGYELAKDNTTCDDIDECVEDGFCSQKCKNLQGSYECSCHFGYELKNRTCLANGADPVLVFTTLTHIRKLYLRANDYFPVHDAVTRSTSVDVDPRDSRVYWTDLSRSGSAIYATQLDGTGFKSVISSGLLIPEDVAVDYVGRNLYITDSGLQQILVCRLDGSICHVLHQRNVDKPRALALEPAEGRMYWSDWGNATGIYRSGMDGSQRVTLVSQDIQWPNGITIDHTTYRLYWCDAKLYRIEYITLDGRNRKIVLQDSVFHPFSITVFEDTLYWTDWNDFSLRACNKFTGHNHTVMLKENGNRIIGVHVYHPVLSRDVPNPCWMNMCTHICVITPQKKAKCVCPPGFQLSGGRTCLMGNNSPQLFIAEGSVIFHLQPEAVGNDLIKKLPISQLQNIGDIAFNWKTRSIFISDKDKKEILQISTTSLHNVVLVKNHIDSVDGLAYDWLGENLYWVDSVKGTIEVLSLNTTARSIVLSNLTRPLAVVLSPEKGLMFVSVVGGQRPHVAMYHMDGTNGKILTSVTGLPISLSLHPQSHRLYWADPKTETIASIDYLNSNSSTIVHKRHVSHITSVTVGNKFIYWVDSQRHQINLLRQDENRSLHTLPLPGNVSSVVVRKVNYVHIFVSDPHSPCSINNGGCSDICLTKPVGRVCACSIGKTLGKNGKDCAVSTECTADEFKCKSTATCLLHSYRCDGTPDCDDSSDEERCEPSLRCPEGDFQCRNGRCILNAWKCDTKDDCGDSSDEQDCDTPIECGAKKFRCGDGQCIPNLWVCDNQKDCDNDNSDEENCKESECHENQFRCNYGQCLPATWLCDGAADCSDGSDESPEKCGKQSRTCHTSEFRCENGLCIDKAMKCDHRNDCEDNSDEINCAINSTCREGMFKCGDGTCIYLHEICDGHDDCNNDELNCSARRECSETEFLCSRTNRCIPRQWVCDNDDDCGDMSDEELRICHHKPSTAPPPPRSGTCDEFTCGSGECVPLTKVCNGEPDCLDYSDEGHLCATSCDKTNGGCSHFCSPSPTGSRCTCIAGYRLLPDEKTCDDENECLVSGVCSQFCNNTKGGFKCSCAEGYFLSHDHRKCKADGGTAVLVYLLPDQIRALDLSSHSQRLYMQGDRTDIRGLDYDAADGVFFWSEWKEGTLNKFNIGSNRNDVIVHDIKRPYYVKWDWIAKIIYYTNGDASIMACSRTGEFCTVVVKSIAKNVNSFELAPAHGVMFWTVWNEVRDSGPGLIERSHMDGSGRIIVLSDKIYWPTSITVDSVLETIYWTDVKLQIMESADFHGLNRKVIVQDGMNYPFSMTIFEDYVYWADWGTDSILRCNKFKAEDCLNLHKGDVKAETMVVVHKVKQPQSFNRCLNSRCPQMCLQTAVGFSCRCDRRFHLVNGTCIPENIYTNVNAETSKPKPLVYDCDEKFCQNDGECKISDRKRTCSCPAAYKGVHCEIQIEEILPPHDYSWVIALLLGIFAVVAIILVILICRQHRSKISKLGDSVAVSFRNPRYLFRKKGLITDTDDAATDELMLGKKGAYAQPGFGNPLFNQRPYTDPGPEDGDYKRWPSYDSDDSAFVSEYYSREDSSLTLDQTSMSSKERIVQFFKRI